MFGLFNREPKLLKISHAEHVVIVGNLRGIINDRDATIGRLQRENARLLAEVSEAQGQKDEGATYVLKSLAECLGLADWSIQDGSETWEGDVSATMYRILVDAGVIDDEDNAVATHSKIAAHIAEANATINDLRPDAMKHRERLRRDRENAAAKRATKAVQAA